MKRQKLINLNQMKKTHYDKVLVKFHEKLENFNLDFVLTCKKNI